MSDIFDVLAAGVKSVPLPSPGKYVAVDPTLYEGVWRGAYAKDSAHPTGQDFSFKISNVQGFRAKVEFKVGSGPIKSQDVLIKNDSFRVGDTKFILKKAGSAEIATVETNPANGQSVLKRAPIKLDGFTEPVDRNAELLASLSDPTNAFITSLGFPAPSSDRTDAFISSLGLKVPSSSDDPTDAFITSLGLKVPSSDPTDALILSLGFKVPKVAPALPPFVDKTA